MILQRDCGVWPLVDDICIDTCRVEEADASVWLASTECAWELGGHFDFILLHNRVWLDLAPYTLAYGGWYLDTYVWFRLVAGRRDQYLDCTDESCEQYIDCAADPSECAQVPGATCNARGVCENESFVQVASYGVHFDYEDHCVPGSWCPLYLNGFIDTMTAIAADPYPDVFAPLLGYVDEQTWQDLPAIFPRCSEDADCPDETGRHFASRCHVDAGEADGTCQVRPYHIYGAHLYPDEVEMILAEDPSDPQYQFLSDPLVEPFLPTCTAASELSRTLRASRWAQGSWP